MVITCINYHLKLRIMVHGNWLYNLITIRSLTRSPLLICQGVGPLLICHGVGPLLICHGVEDLNSKPTSLCSYSLMQHA
jgi:hypothetical protein